MSVLALNTCIHSITKLGIAILLTLLVPALVVGVVMGSLNAVRIERTSEKRKRFRE